MRKWKPCKPYPAARCAAVRYWMLVWFIDMNHTYFKPVDPLVLCTQCLGTKFRYLVVWIPLKRGVYFFFVAGYLVNNHVLRVIALRYGQPDQTINFEDFILCIVRMRRMISKLQYLSSCYFGSMTAVGVGTIYPFLLSEKLNLFSWRCNGKVDDKRI